MRGNRVRHGSLVQFVELCRKLMFLSGRRCRKGDDGDCTHKYKLHTLMGCADNYYALQIPGQ